MAGNRQALLKKKIMYADAESLRASIVGRKRRKWFRNTGNLVKVVRVVKMSLVRNLHAYAILSHPKTNDHANV